MFLVVGLNRTSRGSYIRVVPIQFISSTLALSPHGEMDGQINGCTWLVRVCRVSEDASRTPALSFSTRIHEYIGWKSRDIFSFLPRVSSFVYSLILAFSSLTPHSWPSGGHSKYSKTSPRSLEIYFHLREILRMNGTSHIDENKAEFLGLRNIIGRYEKFVWQSLGAFR